jgi:hypothetical protein
VSAAEAGGNEADMVDPRLEDHAVGVELQIMELVERRERAATQGRTAAAEAFQREIDVLQEDLARTADDIARQA